LNLFELLLNYWEQILYFINSKNNRTDYIILDSVVSALISIYNHPIRKEEFVKKMQDPAELNQNSFKFNRSKNNHDNHGSESMNNRILKTLKLIIIECFAKLINDSQDLKDKYFYKYDFSTNESFKENSFRYEHTTGFTWTKRARIFMQTCLNLLESTQANDRDLQLGCMSFLRLIVKDDLKMQNCLINTARVVESRLTHSLKNLLMRKALPKQFQKQVRNFENRI
jgi:hypothetical protein